MANIAIIIDSIAGGGAEKVMITLTNALISLGQRVTLFYLKPGFDYDVDANFPAVYGLEGYSGKLRSWSGRRKQAQVLQQNIAKVERDSGQFDLVLVNLLEAMKLAQLCEFANAYYIIHRDIDSELSREWRLGPYKYFYMRKVFQGLSDKRLITVSNQLLSHIQESRLFTPKSIQCIYNPCDEAQIQRLSQQPLPPEFAYLAQQPYILHVGRAAKAKRHDVLFGALRRIDPAYTLVCLAARTQRLQKLANQYAVEGRVILPGFQQNPYPWMRHAQALVLSSDFEGLGMVLIEALMCGTKVVSTDCPTGPNEILTGDLATYLVPTGDPEALSVAIRQVLGDPSPISRPDILDNIAPEYVARQYLGLINASNE